MSTHVPGFQSFFRFYASFCIGQISHQLSSIRVKPDMNPGSLAVLRGSEQLLPNALDPSARNPKQVKNTILSIWIKGGNLAFR